MNMKRIFLLTLAIAMPLVFSGCSSSQDSVSKKEDKAKVLSQETKNAKAAVYFFWGEGCPHCAEEKPFLEEMEEKYPELEVKMLETYKDKENSELFQEMAAAYGTQARGVPVTFIGDTEPIVGFSERMETEIEDRIKTCLEKECVNPISKIN
ncbi:MAG: redoxin family protein [Patescibacteria group bacterium]